MYHMCADNPQRHLATVYGLALPLPQQGARPTGLGKMVLVGEVRSWSWMSWT